MPKHTVTTIIQGRASYRPTRLDYFPSAKGQRHGSLKRRSTGKTQSETDQSKNLQDWLTSRGLPCETQAKLIHRNIETMIHATGGSRF